MARWRQTVTGSVGAWLGVDERELDAAAERSGLERTLDLAGLGGAHHAVVAFGVLPFLGHQAVGPACRSLVASIRDWGIEGQYQVPSTRIAPWVPPWLPSWSTR